MQPAPPPSSFACVLSKDSDKYESTLAKSQPETVLVVERGSYAEVKIAPPPPACLEDHSLPQYELVETSMMHLSMTSRSVRAYSPAPGRTELRVDLSYDQALDLRAKIDLVLRVMSPERRSVLKRESVRVV